MSEDSDIERVIRQLIEVGGRTAQDLGLGRVVGQIMVLLYLSPAERSLGDIAQDLGLSKAAVSVAARQLESLGLLRRSWKQMDRRTYYRTADDIVTALHQGLLALVRNKMGILATELKQAEEQLKHSGTDKEAGFVLNRIQRAQKLRNVAMAVLENPVVKLFSRA